MKNMLSVGWADQQTTTMFDNMAALHGFAVVAVRVPKVDDGPSEVLVFGLSHHVRKMSLRPPQFFVPVECNDTKTGGKHPLGVGTVAVCTGQMT